MKKLVALVLAAMLCFGSAQAATEREQRMYELAQERYGIDLSGFSYDQLDKLRRLIINILWERGSNPVTVGEGIYEVGVDIPADTWNITVVSGGTAYICYGAKLAAGGKLVQPFSDGYVVDTLGPSHGWISLRLQEGFFFQVGGDDVEFTRYATTQPAFEW